MEHHHKEISELGMVAYIEGLKDLNVEEVERGCKKSLHLVDRMPTVAHIREHAKESLSEMSDKVAAIAVYLDARMWAARNIDKNPDKRDYLPPTIEWAMKVCGGFEPFVEIDDKHWTQRKFVDAYLAAKQDLREQGITTPEEARKHLKLNPSGV
jgi:hypothetical protein